MNTHARSTTRANNNNNNTASSVSMSKEVDLIDLTNTHEKVTPMDAVGEISKAVEKMSNVVKTCEIINAFGQFTQKAKEIEEFLVDDPVDVDDMMEALKKVAEIHKNIGAGKPVNPESVGSVYAILNSKLENIQKTVIKCNQNPLSQEEMTVLCGVAKKYQETETKRLSVIKTHCTFELAKGEFLNVTKDMVKLHELAQEMETIMKQLPLFTIPNSKT